jgi:hypothetical protein
VTSGWVRRPGTRLDTVRVNVCDETVKPLESRTPGNLPRGAETDESRNLPRPATLRGGPRPIPHHKAGSRAERRKRHESQESFQKARPLSFCAKNPVSSNRSAFRGVTGDPSVNGQGFGTVSTLGSPQADKRARITPHLPADSSHSLGQCGVAGDLRTAERHSKFDSRRTLSNRYSSRGLQARRGSQRLEAHSKRRTRGRGSRLHRCRKYAAHAWPVEKTCRP